MVWTDHQGPPALPPAVSDLLSWDLLRQSWRRGLAITGPPNPGLNPDPGRYLIEYVPCPRHQGGQAVNSNPNPAPPSSPDRSDPNPTPTSDANPESEGYPKFIIQYLVPDPSPGQNPNPTPSSPGAASWADKFCVVRAWLEEMCWYTPRPGYPLAATAAGGSGGIGSISHGSGSGGGVVDSSGSDVTDASRAMALLLRASRAPLTLSEPSPSTTHGNVHAQWVDFTIAVSLHSRTHLFTPRPTPNPSPPPPSPQASLCLSSMLRVDACLVLPDPGPCHAQGGVRQMWGTVCRHVPPTSSSGGGSRADEGPVVLTESQAAALLAKTGVAAQWAAMMGAPSSDPGEIPSPGHGVLSEALFGSGGGRCVIAVPLAAGGDREAGQGLGLGLGVGPVWLAVVQAPRRLSPPETQMVASLCGVFATLAEHRVGLARLSRVERRLRRACWVRDVHALRARAAWQIRHASASASADADVNARGERIIADSSSSGAVQQEEARLQAVVAALLATSTDTMTTTGSSDAKPLPLPHLPLPTDATISLVGLGAPEVWAAVLYMRGGEGGSRGGGGVGALALVPPTVAARCLAQWTPLAVSSNSSSSSGGSGSGGEGGGRFVDVFIPVAGAEGRGDLGLSAWSGAMQGQCWALRARFPDPNPIPNPNPDGMIRALCALCNLPPNPNPPRSPAPDHTLAFAPASQDAAGDDASLQASLLLQMLTAIAADLRACLGPPHMLSQLTITKARLSQTLALTHACTVLAGAVSAHLDILHSLAELGAAIGMAGKDAHDPNPSSSPGGAWFARLHWFEVEATPNPPPTPDPDLGFESESGANASSSSSSSSSSSGGGGGGQWRVADVLPEEVSHGDSHRTIRVTVDNDDTVPSPSPSPIARMLAQGRWRKRDSPFAHRLPFLTQPSAASGPAPGIFYSPDDVVDSNPTTTPTPASTAARAAGEGSLRVWLDVSCPGHAPLFADGAVSARACLEVHVPASALPLFEAVSGDNADAVGGVGAPLVTLVHAMRDAVLAVALRQRAEVDRRQAVAALGLSRRQQAVMAACLGELCTEGRLPEPPSPAARPPTSLYVPLMLARIQAELARLPGVMGTALSARDTVQALELYSQFVPAPGFAGYHPALGGSGGSGALSPYLRPVSVTVGSATPASSSPAFARLTEALDGVRYSDGVPDSPTFTAQDPRGEPGVLGGSSI